MWLQLISVSKNKICLKGTKISDIELTYLLTYLLTPWCRILFGKLTVTQQKKISDIEGVQKKRDDGTESCSTRGVRKIFLTVAGSLG
jgi:hypothetical protein